MLKILKFARKIYNINKAIERFKIVVYNRYINYNKDVNIILKYIRIDFIVAITLK